MCYCVYLGADADLPLVASDVEDLVFSVQTVATSDVAVAPHFTKKNIYHLGSWQGCSCGFANDIDFEDTELVAKNSSSVNALLAFIASALSQEGTVELYTCWAGNQWQTPKERRSTSLNEVQLHGFELEEDVLLTFYRPLVMLNTKIQLFTGLTLLGTIEAKVVDASMGVIRGTLKPTSAYYDNCQPFFRAHLETPDWKGLAALKLKAISPLIGEIFAEGGIDIADVEGFDEIDANVCGIGFQQMKQLFPEG